MTSRRLLYIAFWYPPSRASGVYRALATTRAFVEAGWEVTVVTTTERFLENEIGSLDRSLLSEIPAAARVERVPFSFDPDLREVGHFRGNFPVMWQAWRSLMGPIKDSLLAPITSRMPELEESYSSWIDPVVAAIAERGEKFDHVLATGNPFSSFEAARRIADELDIPYAVDFRDPWTIDVFTGNRARLPAGTELVEKRIVDGASSCIHVNDAIAEAYATKYPDAADKQHVVLNGFDQDSVHITPATYAGGPLRFGILGTVNDRWPLEPILQAWRVVRNELPVGSKLILGGHLGYFAKSAEPLERVLPGEADGFEFIGAVSKSEVAAFYASLDVVIVPVPGSPLVTSGKIYEAMAVGIPLVCVQAEGGDARRVSGDHPLAQMANPNVQSVANALRAAERARKEQGSDDIQFVRQAMRNFDRQVTMARMVQLIEESR